MYTNNRKSFWDALNRAIFFVFEVLFWLFSFSTSAHFLFTIFGNWTQTALGLMIFEGGLIGWRANFALKTDPITKTLSGIGMLAAGTASVFSTVADIVLIQSGTVITSDWQLYTLYAIGTVTAIHLMLIFGLAIVKNFGKIATESDARQGWEPLADSEWQTTLAMPPTQLPTQLPVAQPTQLPAAHTTHQPVAQPTQLPTPPAAPAMPAMPAPTAAPAKNYWHHQAASPAAPPPPPAAPAMPTMPTVDDSHPQRPAWLYPVNPAIDPND